MLAEYHFEIEYIKSIDNARVDALNRKVKLQKDKKIKGVILKLDKDGKIRYNYL